MQFSDLASPAFYANPYPSYVKLRAAGPIVALAPGIWVTGHYDVVDHLLRDRSLGRAYLRGVRARYGEERAQGEVFQTFERMLLLMNPPEHTRLRSLLMQVFNARQTASFRELAQVIADELIDGFVAQGEADLVTQFALPLPLKVICRLLDVRLEDERLFSRAVDTVVHALEVAPMSDAQISAANAAMSELKRYFAELLPQRRQQPGDDLISLLLKARDGEDRLSDEEIVANIVLLFVAGHETTASMIGNALIALQRNPGERDRLRADPNLVSAAVAECLRYDTSVQMTARATFTAIDIAGTTLPAGQLIYLCLGSANRDPAHFRDPDTLRIGREESHTRVLSYGGGIHHCLGARLATVELEVALASVMRRLPELHLTGLDSLQWHPRNTLRGVEALHARW